MPLSPLQLAFESRARAFLASHPQIRHEWRDVTSRWWGSRRDLICAPGDSNEIFASLTRDQLTVGATRGDHEDFEDFGRGLSDDALADQAFGHFVDLIVRAGYLAPRPGEG